MTQTQQQLVRLEPLYGQYKQIVNKLKKTLELWQIHTELEKME